MIKVMLSEKEVATIINDISNMIQNAVLIRRDLDIKLRPLLRHKEFVKNLTHLCEKIEMDGNKSLGKLEKERNGKIV